ncbi:MAG: hypothetical protein CYG61_10250 [Actinobacteria bacterium]|nr:MAG: hypothetical protein CYG61_10250 [Actinomycetota bacterium]
MPHPTHPEGVPLDVWLFNQDEAPSGAVIRRHLAARLVVTYSPAGGVVVDLAPEGTEVVAAATEAGRCVVVAPITGSRGRRPVSPDAVTGTADLAIVLPPASCLAPLQPHSLPADEVGVLCRRAVPRLRSGGVLVVGSLGGTADGDRDPLAEAVNAAASAGLAYFQHVVAVMAFDLHTDGATPADRRAEATTRSRRARPSPATASPHPATGTGSGRGLSHVDLLVFTRRCP